MNKQETGYIKVIEGNSNVTFEVIGDATPAYIINEVLQALDGAVDMHYMIDMLLGCNYRITTAIDNRLPIYTVNLNLSLITFEQTYTGNLSCFYDSKLNYII